MTTTRRAAGRFALPITASEAIGYFTPEGERSWVPGWAPIYPAGEASEAPGTVFVTHHDDAEAIWVVEAIDRRACEAAYAVVVLGRRAGTVRVHCADQTSGGCRVDVEYRMTALDPDRPEVLDPFTETAFADMMHHWSSAVRAVVT